MIGLIDLSGVDVSKAKRCTKVGQRRIDRECLLVVENGFVGLLLPVIDRPEFRIGDVILVIELYSFVKINDRGFVIRVAGDRNSLFP